jgi:hypothetical protein
MLGNANFKILKKKWLTSPNKEYPSSLVFDESLISNEWETGSFQFRLLIWGAPFTCRITRPDFRENVRLLCLSSEPVFQSDKLFCLSFFLLRGAIERDVANPLFWDNKTIRHKHLVTMAMKLLSSNRVCVFNLILDWLNNSYGSPFSMWTPNFCCCDLQKNLKIFQYCKQYSKFFQVCFNQSSYFFLSCCT